MTETKIDRAFDDARQANEELFTKTMTARFLKITLHSLTRVKRIALKSLN